MTPLLNILWKVVFAIVTSLVFVAILFRLEEGRWPWGIKRKYYGSCPRCGNWIGQLEVDGLCEDCFVRGNGE